MTEISDLIGIYGTVDMEAQARYSEIAPELGRFFSLYQAPEPIEGYEGQRDGWFRTFERWIEDRRVAVDVDSEPRRFPDHLEALRNMGHRTPELRAMARRILAVATLMRTFESCRPEGSDSELVAGALFADGGFARSLDDATSLHELIWEKFDGMGSWTSFLGGALELELVPIEMRAQLQAPPCVGDVVGKPNPFDPTDTMPVTKLDTSFPAALDYERALHFLNPANWPECSDFWCRMDLKQAISRSEAIYWEKVGIDCDDPALCVDTDLHFTFVRQPNSASTVYRLPDGHPLPGASIVWDTGFLTITRQPNGVHVDTRKFVKFSGSMNGAYLGMLMCPIGYGAAVEDALFNCAAKADHPEVVPFPIPAGEGPLWHLPEGQRPASVGAKRYTPVLDGRQRPEQRKPGGKKPGGRKPPDPAPDPNPAEPANSPLEHAVQELADAAQACIKEQATVYEQAMVKAKAGDYGLDDYVATMTDLWSRSLKDLPMLSKLGRTVIGSIPHLYPTPDRDDEER